MTSLLDRITAIQRPAPTNNGTTNSNGASHTVVPPAQQQTPFSGNGGGESPGAQLPSEDSDPESGADIEAPGIHAITKNTNYWFERQVYPIERQAEAFAAEWAQKGLPRHDVPRTEPLEPEQVLEKLSGQLFREWQERVRTRMQDAIEDGSQRVGDAVATIRGAVGRLEAIQGESTELRTRIGRLKADAERDVRPVRYDQIIGGGIFWFAAVFLALVEFFANFPVLRLLLPMSTALAAAGQRAAENIDDSSWFAGPLMLFREMMMHFEATIVAFVAVIILVLLGKTLGGSLRPLLALSEKEHPLAAQTVRAHRRQHWLITGASIFGIAFVLCFLFFSRRDIARTTAERVKSEEVSLANARADQATATDPTKVAGSMARVLRGERTLLQRRDDADFAKTVQQNNFPILLLNLGLVLTAVVLGFCYKSEDLGDKRGEHPEIPPLRNRISAIEMEMIEVTREGRNAVSQAHMGISRVQHLLRANPLKGWQSKVERLESIIPRFRGENARQRGLDPANIRAFDAEPRLELPPVDDSFEFQEPEEFARLKTEFADVSQRFALVAPRATPAHGFMAVRA